MNICGLQKLTLLDYPSKLACTVFTGGCNFRCPFCHNSSLVTKTEGRGHIEEREFFDFLDKRRDALDGVCITGGEPTLQADLPDFIAGIKKRGFLVKLDTNGYLPDTLASLIRSGNIDYVAMDIKNSPENYVSTVGLDKDSFDMERIYESVRILQFCGIGHEFITTVVREYHTVHDMERIGEWLRGAEKYFLQTFVNSNDLICENLSAHTTETMKEFLSVIQKYIPNARLRGVE